MFSIIRKAIKEVREDERKAKELLKKQYRELEANLAYQKALEERSSRAFTWGDMQDIMRVASRGVRIVIKHADGTVVNMQQEDPLETYNKQINNGVF